MGVGLESVLFRHSRRRAIKELSPHHNIMLSSISKYILYKIDRRFKILLSNVVQEKERGFCLTVKYNRKKSSATSM